MQEADKYIDKLRQLKETFSYRDLARRTGINANKLRDICIGKSRLITVDEAKAIDSMF